MNELSQHELNYRNAPQHAVHIEQLLAKHRIQNNLVLLSDKKKKIKTSKGKKI
jgi:hypothetical protein